MLKQQKTALEQAIACLASRAHSKMELRKKLALKKVYTRMEIDEALSECERLGFLNDADFAEIAVSEMKNRSFGNRKIQMKLREKGVDHELVGHALEREEEQDGRDQESLALELLRRRASSWEASTPEEAMKRKNRALRLLASRGFPSGVAYASVRLFFQNQNNNDEMDTASE